jgi:hypothetical protein
VRERFVLKDPPGGTDERRQRSVWGPQPILEVDDAATRTLAEDTPENMRAADGNVASDSCRPEQRRRYKYRENVTPV